MDAYFDNLLLSVYKKADILYRKSQRNENYLNHDQKCKIDEKKSLFVESIGQVRLENLEKLNKSNFEREFNSFCFLFDYVPRKINEIHSDLSELCPDFDFIDEHFGYLIIIRHPGSYLSMEQIELFRQLVSYCHKLTRDDSIFFKNAPVSRNFLNYLV
jgi:hypothetical protein